MQHSNTAIKFNRSINDFSWHIKTLVSEFLRLEREAIAINMRAEGYRTSQIARIMYGQADKQTISRVCKLLSAREKELDWEIKRLETAIIELKPARHAELAKTVKMTAINGSRATKTSKRTTHKHSKPTVPTMQPIEEVSACHTNN